MYVLLLAGGGGTRLWPISTKEKPKQFIKLDGEEYSLFQNTVKRCLEFSDPEHIIVLTGEKYRNLVIEQTSEIGVSLSGENILCEPKAKGTLPAIVFGVKGLSPDEKVAVFSCDHMIGRLDNFYDTVKKALTFSNCLVTFGIKPDRPETGYGYIKPGKAIGCGFEAEKFCEKPCLSVALSYLEQGYLWNSGMFVFEAGFFMSEVKKYAPDVYAAFLNPDTAFDVTPDVSIDFGVMEKSDKVCVIPAELDWIDLGSFKSVYDYKSGRCDENGNIIIGKASVIDCRNCLVYSTGERINVMGITDSAVVSHNGSMLVSKFDDLQRIKELIEH